MSVNTITRPPALMAGDVLELLDRSRGALLEACHSAEPDERYTYAHLGALRAAAALLACGPKRAVGSAPRSAWVTLANHHPDLGEWAMFFAATGRRGRAAQAGICEVSSDEADELIRQAEEFLQVCCFRLGLAEVGKLAAIHEVGCGDD